MQCLFALFVLISVALATTESTPWKTSFTFPNKNDAYGHRLIGIVGGDEASPNQFPYQVGLYIVYQMSTAFCGGSLISLNYILTAAHCALGAISIEVVLGAHNISNDTESTQQRQTTESYTVHPEWNAGTLVNDLAVVRLSSPATLNSYVQTIKLASGSDTYANDQGIITGWGKTSDDQATVTAKLRYATNTILSNSQCKSIDANYNSVIQDTHLCLSGEGNTSICKGDSGGPLVSNGVQVGVTSFSYKSCEASKPSVFTRLSEYAQWIKDNSDVAY